MNSKLNYTSIESYSSTYAKKLSNKFFETKDAIDGKEILALSNISQVNLLVIKNLFQKWKKETGKLQSPYFNYEAEEVKEALKHFMNTLSNHIAIKRNQFEPLLKKSVTDAIFLIFSPYDFYSKEINHPERSRISIDDLRDVCKYVKINKLLLDELIKRFRQEDIVEVFNDEGLSHFNEIYEETALPNLAYEEYLEAFSKVHPLSLDMVFEEAQEESTDEDFNKPLAKDLEKTMSSHRKTGQEAVKNLNEQFYKTQSTLHERLASKPGPTLADLHQKNKIDSIKKHITLNQKFMFIRELFGGSQEAYQQALDKLEQSTSLTEATEYLHSHYVQKYNWDMEGEEVKEFLEILNKKYD